MGLFDTIIFNKSVIQGIAPEVDKYLRLLRQEEVTFQTKDFDCALKNFFIEEGRLFAEHIEAQWVEENGPFGGFMEPISKEKKPCNKTCTIQAYDALNSEEVDIWIEIQFVFIDGFLQKASLVGYEETDAAIRIEREKQFQKKLAESIAFGKTFRGKVQGAFGQFLRKFARKIINFGNLIQRISFKF